MISRQWDDPKVSNGVAFGVAGAMVLVLAALSACTNRNEVTRPQAPQPGAGSELPRPGTPVEPAQTQSTPAAQPLAAPAADSSTKGALAAPSGNNAAVMRACREMCDSMAKNCEEQAVKTCERNCTRYEHVAAECQAAARIALNCARDAEDLLCIEMAPASCSPQFKQYHTCTADPKSYQPVATSDAEQQDDWQLVKDDAHEFSVEFPTPPQQLDVNGMKRWVAAMGQAKLYAASYEAPQHSKLAMKLMKSGERFLGKCTEDYRLRGQYETPGAIHVSFVAQCKDGTPWTGKLHLVGGDRVFVTAVEGSVDSAVSGRFFESFKQM